jgi:PAS domain S-box-containing protein
MRRLSHHKYVNSGYFSKAGRYIFIAVWILFVLRSSIAIALNENSFPSSIFFDLLVAIVITWALRNFMVKLKEFSLGKEIEQAKLFHVNPHPMWIYDLSTLSFLKVNDAAISLYGYSEQEFLNMKVSDIRPDEDVPALISSTDKIKLEFHHDYHWSGTWRHLKKNGEMIYVEISSHETIFDGKKVELVLAYDITEKILQERATQLLNQDLEKKVMTRTNDLLQLNRRLVDQNKIIKSANLELFTISNQLQQANLQIQEHANLKTRFVSMASHEFRTPLANIAFAAGSLRHHFHKLEPSIILNKLKDIELYVRHMSTLLDDVLTIGKDEANAEVKKDLLDMNQFILHIVHEVKTANSHSHEIAIEMEEHLRPLYTDEKYLRNIFINLLNNAIKYSPHEKTIFFNVFQINDEIHFQVRDRGIGMDKQSLPKIFEPFYRLNNAPSIPGTGLGLSIVKRAVDLLGARIEVDSEINQGSVFTVVLPIEELATSPR